MSKSGFCTQCFMEKWRKKNFKQLREYRKNYYQENKERCSELNRKSQKKYEREQPERFKRYHENYYRRNREKIKAYHKGYYEGNKEEVSKRHLEYSNRRYREDEGFRIRKQLGSALSMVIRVYIKTGKIRNPLKKYNLDWEGIIKQLSPIPKDREKYHVDHIMELHRFDLTNIEQIQLAFAPENHRWVLAGENQGRDRKA